MRKERSMPDEEEMERRLWRTMPWDAAVMVPSEEADAEDEIDTAGKDGDKQ